MQIDRNVVRIKGTDYVGTMTGQHKGTLYTHYNPSSYDGEEWFPMGDLLVLYTDDMLKPLLKRFTPAEHVSNPRNQYVVGSPALWFRMGYYDTTRYAYMEPRSYRINLAQFVNLFRGSDPNNPDPYAKRFVFRDAGIPAYGWCPDAISSFSESGLPQLRTWQLKYADVGSLTTTYGNSVKIATLDNPASAMGSLIENDPVTLSAGKSTVVSFDKPVIYSGYVSTGPSTMTITATQLSPYAVKIAASGAGTGDVTLRYRTIDDIYQNSEEPPTFSIPCADNGETVNLDKINAFVHAYAITKLEAGHDTYTDFSLYRNALEHTLNDCNLKSPRWIEFTWRGHPDMQPRDMILFTEKDGSKNYYEIDNLTLEHRDGGLVSQVKAIYKCAY